MRNHYPEEKIYNLEPFNKLYHVCYTTKNEGNTEKVNMKQWLQDLLYFLFSMIMLTGSGNWGKIYWSEVHEQAKAAEFRVRPEYPQPGNYLSLTEIIKEWC